ncbi:hypothetical protein [Oleiharenicola sp. Vm1]|uniref:hypothetical protein n=1 Tax=Oleiharenicola sp. Vm1 TaxID=3398393 RepID=UPI0039F46418
MKTSEMTFAEWLRALDRRGSTEDPIYCDGRETTPTELAHRFDSLERIAGVRIQYFGGTPLHLIAGTAGGMLRERARTVRICA